MIEAIFTFACFALFFCGLLSVCWGVVGMRYEEESLYDEPWPTDGITREPKEND